MKGDRDRFAGRVSDLIDAENRGFVLGLLAVRASAKTPIERARLHELARKRGVGDLYRIQAKLRNFLS